MKISFSSALQSWWRIEVQIHPSLEGLYGGKMSFFKYNIYYLYFSSFILKKEHAVFY